MLLKWVRNNTVKKDSEGPLFVLLDPPANMILDPVGYHLHVLHDKLYIN